MSPTPMLVFIAGMLPVIFAGLGALPLLITLRLKRDYHGTANAIAAGLMIGASLGLILDGIAHGSYRLVLGVMLGALFVYWLHWQLSDQDSKMLARLPYSTNPKVIIILTVMTAHSMAEGIGLGMSYGHGATLGTIIVLALAIHKIPEGLAISLILVPHGVPIWKAALWNMLTCLPLPIMSLIAYGTILLFQPLLPMGLGLAAGAMMTMVFLELLPEARETISSSKAYSITVGAVIVMVTLQMMITH